MVKIQAPWKANRQRDESIPIPGDVGGKMTRKPLDRDMMVYNEEKTIFGLITPSVDVYEELLLTIREEGVLGLVAYFYAFWEDGVGLKINVKRVQPPEIWLDLVEPAGISKTYVYGITDSQPTFLDEVPKLQTMSTPLSTWRNSGHSISIGERRNMYKE